MGPRSWILHHGASTFVMRQYVHMTILLIGCGQFPYSMDMGRDYEILSKYTCLVFQPFYGSFFSTWLTLSILQGYGPWTGYTNLVLILAYLDLLYPRYLSSYFNDILLLQWYGPIAWHNNLDTNFSILDFVRSSTTWAWDNWTAFLYGWQFAGDTLDMCF
jgi:hypothetical protein